MHQHRHPEAAMDQGQEGVGLARLLLGALLLLVVAAAGWQFWIDLVTLD